MFPGVQEWVHKLEEGAGVRYIKIGALLLAVLTLFAAYDVREWKGFSTPEAMDAAQLARNISRGQGFTTEFIRPFSIHLLEKHGSKTGFEVLEEPHPDLSNPPVYPWLLAGLMRVLPVPFDITRDSTFSRYDPEMMITFLNQFLFLLAAFMIYRLGTRLFDRGVGVLAAMLYLATDLFWRFSISGLPTMLLTVIFLGVAWCLILLEENHRLEKRGSFWFVAVSAAVGGLVGVGALTRYSFAWLIVPVLIFFLAYLGRRRLAASGAAATVCIVLMAPWLARNYQLSGSLFGTSGYAYYQGTQSFAGNRLERMLGDDLERDLRNVNFEQVVRKLLVNSGEIIRSEVIQLGGSWLSAFFFIGLLIPFRSPALNPLRVFLLASLAVMILVEAGGKTHLSELTPEVNGENLLAILAPLVFVYGAGAFFVLLDQTYFPLPQLRFLAVLVFGLVISAPLIYTLMPPRSPTGTWSYPPYNPPGIQDIAHYFKEKELIMSDMPWAVAWYGDRRCVWVTTDAPLGPKTASTSDFFMIHDFHDRVKGLYLTLLTTDAHFYSEISRDQDYVWGRFMVDVLAKTNIPAGFPLTYAPPGMIIQGQIFLTDYPRWYFAPRPQ